MKERLDVRLTQRHLEAYRATTEAVIMAGVGDAKGK